MKILKIILLIGSLLLLSACAGNDVASATSAACNTSELAVITVDIASPDPVEDLHLGTVELSAKETLDRLVPALSQYNETLGLTAVDMHGDINGQSKADQHWGKWCAFLTYATVKVSWKTTVFLAHELVPGSCPYRAVREHEQKHVDLDKKLMPLLESSIKAALLSLPQTSHWQESGSHALAELNRQAQLVTQQAIDVFSKDRDTEQLAIDTPEEYDRIVAMCGRPAFPQFPDGNKTNM